MKPQPISHVITILFVAAVGLGILAGPSHAQTIIYAEDFDIGPGGWTPVDLNAQGQLHWQQSTDNEGNGVAWCGVEDPNFTGGSGYGNNWHQWLEKEFDFNAGSMNFDIQYDTEAGFDKVAVLVSYNGRGYGGQEWDCMTVFEGSSVGAFENHSLYWDMYAAPPIRIAFHFWSDEGWSDEDGLYPTDGACRLDNIAIGNDLSTFETGLDGWVPSVAASSGGPYRLVDYNPANAETTPDDRFWAAYEESGQFRYQFPHSDQCTALNRIGIESPWVPLPAEPEYVSLSFDVFRDIPAENGLFYDFQVAFQTPGGVTDFRSDYFIYYTVITDSWSPSTFNLMNVVLNRYWDSNGQEVREYGSIFEPGATAMKVRLYAIERSIQPQHTPTPYFDDVIVRVPSGEGTVAGNVTADCPEAGSPLYGVRVVAYALGEEVASAVTDVAGNYELTLPEGEYTLTMVRPLGYAAESDDYPVTVLSDVRTEQDYALSCLAIPYSPRTIGYWKHQVSLATGNGAVGRGIMAFDPKASTTLHTDVTSPVCDYLDVIATHFNSNAVNEVAVYVPPVSGACQDKLAIAGELLNLQGSEEMVARAKQQLLALLLNVAAGNVHLTQVISEDGATVSQAVTFCDNLIDAGDGDHELAKTIADLINNGLPVPAGMIPLNTIDIAYRNTPGVASMELENLPNPFNPLTRIEFTLGTNSGYVLSIYDSGGRLIRLMHGAGHAGRNHVVWDGTNSAGKHVSAGLYFAALESDGNRATTKMMLVK